MILKPETFCPAISAKAVVKTKQIKLWEKLVHRKMIVDVSDTRLLLAAVSSALSGRPGNL